MRKKFLILVGIILFIPSITLANSISNINMDIYVDSNGTAHVTEEWTTYLNEGTECYKPYYNLGESKISNFKVMMNEKLFTYDDYWNINGSFEDKRYKNGINYISDGLELCFGISNYGSNKYTLSYDISNFVVSTSDGYQMIYWTLFPYEFDPSPERVYIKVHSDFNYSDNLDVWGYGKYGAPTYVYNGYIEMDSETTVTSSEYMTILVKFPSDSFNTSVTLDNTFDYYLDMANDGAKSYSNKKTNGFISAAKEVIRIMFEILFPVLIIVIASSRASSKIYNYGYKDNKKLEKNNTPFFRDIPCNKDIYLANALTKLNSTTFTTYKDTNIFGAIILKWIKENKVVFKNETKGVFNKYTSSIDLTKNPSFDNPLERELFDIMYEASKDGILEAKELEKWCNNHYSKFFSLFERINKVEIEKLKTAGHIYKRSSREECKRKTVMDDTIYNESVKLYGLKLFLDEFSKIDTREVIEVHTWDEYLMYAYLFGIADKVAKQLKNMYPEVLVDNNIDFDTLMYINYVSTSSVKAASVAQSRAESYSSGGGGFSSGGGGGGSFGGGGGGGGVR